jgi:hypothetical protein
METTIRSLETIAQEIRKDWGRKIDFAAKPYLDAMASMNSINDKFGYDDARGVVLYFLSNSSKWRGETAKRIKTELRLMLKAK